MKDPKNIAILVLLAAAAFLLGHSFRGNPAQAQGYPGGSTDSNNRMIAVTGTIGSGVSVLWVIDTENGNLAVYQCKGGKSIALVAARKIEWDLKIEYFHDESLFSPSQLKKRFFDQPGEGASEGTRPEESGPQKGSDSSMVEEK
jgi:hypothetical protein